MCIIILNSSNPQFSFIIRKNPASGLQLKSIRKGTAFGYYKKDSNQEFVIYFKDGDGEMSYKESTDQEFEYLNNLQYTSPIFVLNAVSDFFNTVCQKQADDDVEGESNVLFVNLAHIQNKAFNVVEKLEPFFTDVQISIERKVANNYQITIKTKKSLYYLLNFVVVYFGIISWINQNDMDMSDNLIEKLLKCANNIDAEYYTRYIFASRILVTPKNFRKFKPLIEKPNMKLFYGNTALQRRNYIEDRLKFDKPIIDIGCGEGFYAIAFAKKLDPSLKYIAIDTDASCLELVNKKIAKKEITNITTMNSHTDLPRADPTVYDVIISEVVEHMDREKSQEIIRFILDHIKFGKIIITTPNSEFNKFYRLEGKFRHDDHKWEYTRNEFKTYMEETVNGHKVDVQYVDIGDQVDGLTVSQGAIIQPM